MLGRWITPKVTIAAAVSIIFVEILLRHFDGPVWGWFDRYARATAFYAGALLCLEVVRDYDHRLMRLSWLLFSVEGFMLAVHFTGVWPTPVAIAFIHLGLLGLLGGMSVTWWQLRRFGLGFHARWPDYIAVGLIVAAMLTFFGLSYGRHWMHPMLASARTLLFLSAAVAVLLNRFCLQMGGGQIAGVFRFFILYVGVRCAVNVVFALNQIYTPLLDEPYRIIDSTYPWIYLLAVSLRAQVVVNGNRQLENLCALASPGTPQP
jgi:hypothetical protein